MKLYLNVHVTEDDILHGTHSSEWCPIARAIRRQGSPRVKVSSSTIMMNMYGILWECYRNPIAMDYIHSYDMTNSAEPETIMLSFEAAPPYYLG